MYVTRRLLRSTLPPESEKEKETSFPPSTPRRRAAVRACAKIDEITDVSGPAARNKAMKTSENAGDEKNKRSHQKKVKKEEKHKNKKEAPTLDVSSLHGYQLMVDVHYRGEQYTEARVLDLDPEKQLLFVHYMGWNARFDAWVPAEELAAHGSHTNVTKKKDVSWDGNTPLFMTEEELAAHRQGGKIKPKKALKKRTVLSPKARQAARKALQNVNTDAKEMEERSEAQPVKRVGRKSPKISKKPTTKSPRASKKSPKAVVSSARRTPRRVQVAVGTTDEDSERQNDSEAADLVLDVEIEGREASNDEPEEEGAEREEEEYEEGTTTRKTRKSQRKESPGGSKRKRDLSYGEVEESGESSGTKRSPTNKKKQKSMVSTPAKTAPLPPRSSRGGLGSAAREKLAAIFRQRIQEREQMQQLNDSHTSFQQTLQDPAVEPTATDMTSSAAEETGAKNIAMVNPEVAAAEEYQRQLQQYYYHQQLMLANSLHMNATGGEDPSTFPLQGGIMDPRIIQERLTALEQRRRQQAHVQAYYHQLMLTRERNVRALAANQAFMTASAAVWEQQLKETQSEDGTSSVTSCKDVTGADTSETSKTDKTAAAASSEADESSKSDNESVKESEMSAASAVTSNNAAVTSPDTVEKTAEPCTSAKTSPTKSVSDKSDPADPPTQGVLYEFVL